MSIEAQLNELPEAEAKVQIKKKTGTMYFPGFGSAEIMHLCNTVD